NTPPPPHYYAGNVVRLLRAVDAQYSDLLCDTERDYIGRVLALSTDAQRLYARLLTRKGPLLRVDSLDYREVACVRSALGEIERFGPARLTPAVPADRVLALLTRPEIDALFPHARTRGQRKRECIASIAARYPESCTRGRVAAR